MKNDEKGSGETPLREEDKERMKQALYRYFDSSYTLAKLGSEIHVSPLEMQIICAEIITKLKSENKYPVEFEGREDEFEMAMVRVLLGAFDDQVKFSLSIEQISDSEYKHKCKVCNHGLQERENPCHNCGSEINWKTVE